MINIPIDSHDICFFIEHCLDIEESYLFNEDCTKQSIFFSEFSFLVNDRINIKGRPSGDKCKVIANHIKVKSHEELINDVMVLEIDNGSDQSVFLVNILVFLLLDSPNMRKSSVKF